MILQKKIAHELKRDGAEIWIDYARIKPGEGLPDRIGEALEWCDTLLLIWSKSAAESCYVKLEWHCALDMQKKIIPCIVDDTTRRPLRRSFLCIDFNKFSKGHEQLLRALDLQATRSPSPSSAPIKPVRSKEKIPTQRILKITAVFAVIIIFGLIGTNLLNKYSLKKENKNQNNENVTNRKSAEDSLKAYWDYRQSKMKSQYDMALWFERRDNLTSNAKLKSWQNFLTNYTDDNPYSKEDDDQRNYATNRAAYWKNYLPPQPQLSKLPQEKTVKGMTLVLIRGGTFDMGDTFGDGEADEKPVH